MANEQLAGLLIFFKGKFWEDNVIIIIIIITAFFSALKFAKFCATHSYNKFVK